MRDAWLGAASLASSSLHTLRACIGVPAQATTRFSSSVIRAAFHGSSVGHLLELLHPADAEILSEWVLLSGAICFLAISARSACETKTLQAASSAAKAASE